jgi:DNA-binding Lrp family transcriptional regulator
MVSNKLDNIDMAVIHSLMNDGRKSFRQIAKEIKVSTPTVESHFSRMKRFGIIKTIQPIINIDNLAENPISTISSLVFIKLDLSQSEETISKLSLTPGVTDIYKITGEHNIIIKLIADSPEHLEEIVTRKVAILKGIKSITYEIITKSVKGKNNDNNENNIALLVASKRRIII